MPVFTVPKTNFYAIMHFIGLCVYDCKELVNCQKSFFLMTLALYMTQSIELWDDYLEMIIG